MFLKKVNYTPDERFPADDNNESVLSLTQFKFILFPAGTGG